VEQSKAESDKQSEERAGGKAVDKWKKRVEQSEEQSNERAVGKAVD